MVTWCGTAVLTSAVNVRYSSMEIWEFLPLMLYCIYVLENCFLSKRSIQHSINLSLLGTCTGDLSEHVWVSSPAGLKCDSRGSMTCPKKCWPLRAWPVNLKKTHVTVSSQALQKNFDRHQSERHLYVHLVLELSGIASSREPSKVHLYPDPGQMESDKAKIHLPCLDLVRSF